MKYKVGDKVRLNNVSNYLNTRNFTFIQPMIITRIHNSSEYIVKYQARSKYRKEEINRGETKVWATDLEKHHSPITELFEEFKNA